GVWLQAAQFIRVQKARYIFFDVFFFQAEDGIRDTLYPTVNPEHQGCASQTPKKKTTPAYTIDSTAHPKAYSVTISYTRSFRNQSTATRSYKTSTAKQKAHGDPALDRSTQSSRSLSPKDSSKQNLNPPTKPRDESTTLRQKG